MATRRTAKRAVAVLAMLVLASGCGGSAPNAGTGAATVRPSTGTTSPTAEEAATPFPMPTGAPLTWVTPSPSVTCTEDSASGKLLYKSGARSYSGDLFRPSGGGSFPAMLVLHTSIGLGEHELAYGRWLASQGYVALATDYLAPVGVTPGTLDPNTFQADTAREDLARALDCLRSLAYVDPGRTGAVGFSLGGYFALTLGTRTDVRAVIGYYTGACDTPIDDVCARRYPMATVAGQMRAPVLLLHGQADTVAPFAFIRATQDALQRAGKTSELVPYPGVGHGFDFTNRAASPNYDPRATANAQGRVLAFLQATLH
jgi:carboxymethylenebutenolidase